MARLPKPGERPVFGVHTLPAGEAASAPGWRPETEAQRDARWLRELKAWAARQPVEPDPDQPEDCDECGLPTEDCRCL